MEALCGFESFLRSGTGIAFLLLMDKRIERDPTLNIPLPSQWKVFLPKSLALEEVEQMLTD